jgi:multidrug transporter EmrE-like cation transporter
MSFSTIGGDEMNAVKVVALVLIVAGVLGLAYGSFTYTKETHKTTLGPIELSVKDKETVNVPIWAGVGAIVIGGVLLLIGSKKS